MGSPTDKNTKGTSKPNEPLLGSALMLNHHGRGRDLLRLPERHCSSIPNTKTVTRQRKWYTSSDAMLVVMKKRQCRKEEEVLEEEELMDT
ncbi:hypothetical protein HYALB_00012839 [Hymenoscyphus albidus]|uniref:Uncharacterized protein n=1 Tax=Hymenoscyphus albidus TaxID=595503 RepID=A0A9N9LTV3_9HELO|nr:hypothetical protein HYALB_00012839 [Hymenoscyphus albidus]